MRSSKVIVRIIYLEGEKKGLVMQYSKIRRDKRRKTLEERQKQQENIRDERGA